MTRKLMLDWHNRGINLGIDYWCAWEGRQIWLGAIFLRIQFKDWKIADWHSWYDGNHCSWQFGPFQWNNFRMGSCSKCRD